MKLTVLIALFAMTAPAWAAPTYSVTKTVTLGAPDNWDYVVYDAGLRPRLYRSLSNGNHNC